MSYDFDQVIERRNGDSIKWLQYGPEVLPLWVADMDFTAPEAVIRALQERAAHGIFGYPPVFGSPDELPELRGVLIERMMRLYGWQVQAEEIVLLPGVVTGINLACHTLAAPAGSVLVQTPVYPPFLSAAKNAGITRQDSPLLPSADLSYQIDWAGFEAAITDQTRLFILCNPHNPVGRVFRRDELERMAEICLRRGVAICSDEIHCDLVYQGHAHIPIATLSPEVARSTITLMAPSKTFNIAGLQCSFAIIQDPDLRQRFQHSGQGLVGWVNLMGLVAGLAAYRHGQAWLDALLPYLQANRDFLHQYVREHLPGVKMDLPEGTYLAWLDCRPAGIIGSAYDFFLKEARVALNNGEAFGPGGEGFVRLNFGCPRSTLLEALERMRVALT